MTIEIRKRIKVKSLLVGELKNIIQDSIERQILNEEAALSLGVVETLRLSKVESAKLQHDEQLTLAKIREIAKENKISANMSQGSAMKIHSILYSRNKGSKGPDFYVDLVEYALHSRVSRWIASSGSIEEISNLYEKVVAFNAIAVYPLLLLKAQTDRSSLTGLNIPLLASRIHRMPRSTAEALILLLEDPDNEFNALKVQTIIQRKTEKIMSYKMINEVFQLIEWIEENCKTYSNSLFNHIQICNKNTLTLLDSVIPHIALSASDSTLSSVVISKMLSSYYSSAIVGSKNVLEGEVMFN